MPFEDPLRLLSEVLAQIVADVVRLLPKIFIALIIAILTFFGVRVLNFSLRKLIGLAKLDSMFRQLSGLSLPFSLESLIILLADLGIALISLYAIMSLFLPAQYMQLLHEGLYYGVRVVSIAGVTVALLAIFNSVVGRIRVETRLRSYAMFIVLLLVTAMLVDITALSDPVKNELIGGLSLGVGISIGVFAIWFFFHEYFDELIRRVPTDSSSDPKE